MKCDEILIKEICGIPMWLLISELTFKYFFETIQIEIPFIRKNMK